MQETWVRSLVQEDSPGGGHGNPLQYSCLENPMDRGPWWATVRGVAQSQTRLKSLSTRTYTRVCLCRRINLQFCLLFQWVIFLVSFFCSYFPLNLLFILFFFPLAAWKIPWMEEPGGLQSMGLLKVRHSWVTSLSLLTFMYRRRKWQPTPVFLPGESQGQGSLVGCCLRGHTESNSTEMTWQQQVKN